MIPFCAFYFNRHKQQLCVGTSYKCCNTHRTQLFHKYTRNHPKSLPKNITYRVLFELNPVFEFKFYRVKRILAGIFRSPPITPRKYARTRHCRKSVVFPNAKYSETIEVLRFCARQFANDVRRCRAPGCKLTRISVVISSLFVLGTISTIAG